MRCLVIGGAGFVGAAACRELMRRGVETIAAGRTPRPYGTFTSYLAFDRTDPDQLAGALRAARPDVVLDLAAYQPADVRAVLEAFAGERYVFVSTGVYPDLHGRPAREDDFVPLDGEVPAERLDYLEGKRWCETVLARSSGIAWAVVRPPAIMGADDHTLRIAAYLQRLEDGGPLLVPEETFEGRPAGVAWVRDVGFACALACDLDRDATGPRNVSFDGVTLRDLLEEAGRALRRPPRLVPVPFAELPDSASPYGPNPRRSAGYDLTRIRELGFTPSALADALPETLAWYLARRPTHPGYAGRAAELELARLRGG
jgi:nucleoside-diphosphate-sugar epimerase